MSVVINTNYSATVAANNLAASNTMLQRSLNRLSSGSKIVNPADDAGGLAVSMKLSAAAKRQGAVSSNIGNAVSYLQTQDGALKIAGKVLDRISELKTLYSDPTKNSDDLANYDAEFTQLQSQLDSLTDETFNSVAANGGTVTITSLQEYDLANIFNPGNLSAFIGSGTVAYAVNAQSNLFTSCGSGNCATNIDTRMGGQMTVTYTYEPDTNEVPEPASFAMVGLGVLALGMIGRRRFLASKS